MSYVRVAGTSKSVQYDEVWKRQSSVRLQPSCCCCSWSDARHFQVSWDRSIKLVMPESYCNCVRRISVGNWICYVSSAFYLLYRNYFFVLSYESSSMPTCTQMYFLSRNCRQLGDTPEVGGKRRLTRLHLHTLAFQAIMVRKGSPWLNSMAAATKAALTANRHVCGNTKVRSIRKVWGWVSRNVIWGWMLLG